MNHQSAIIGERKKKFRTVWKKKKDKNRLIKFIQSSNRLERIVKENQRWFDFDEFQSIRLNGMERKKLTVFQSSVEKKWSKIKFKSCLLLGGSTRTELQLKSWLTYIYMVGCSQPQEVVVTVCNNKGHTHYTLKLITFVFTVKPQRSNDLLSYFLSTEH